jgi:hypothetical protein
MCLFLLGLLSPSLEPIDEGRLLFPLPFVGTELDYGMAEI